MPTKTTIDIESMNIFRAVVDEGSFSKAADRLRTTKAQVSRAVSRLEGRLGVQLLQRSTRRVRVTEVGRDFYERTCCIVSALEATEASIASFRGEPQGILKVSAPSEFGMLRVNNWLAEYARRHPKVGIEADFTNRIVDVIHEGIDVAIRVGALDDSELSARKLGEERKGLYATRDYLSKHPSIRKPADLTRHDVIMFTPRGKGGWSLRSGKQVYTYRGAPRYVVNNHLLARHFVESGLGVSLLPVFIAEGAAVDLERVLPKWSTAPSTVHAVFSSTRFMAPKVRAFVDLAVEMFDQPAQPLQPAAD